MKNIDKDTAKSLYKRYLFWLYKTTRDELEKIDRKFTQLDIDNQIYKVLKSRIKHFKKREVDGLEPFLKEWQEYIFEKESDAQKLKFREDGELNHAYLFLALKFEVVKRIIVSRLGKRGLSLFEELCEEAALERIMGDTSGKR